MPYYKIVLQYLIICWEIIWCCFRLLKERCHGVPYWCEQVLIDMVEKRQLMILETEEGSHIEESTIAPNANHIKRIQYRAEHPAAEFKQLNDIFLTATSVST